MWYLSLCEVEHTDEAKDFIQVFIITIAVFGHLGLLKKSGRTSKYSVEVRSLYTLITSMNVVVILGFFKQILPDWNDCTAYIFILDLLLSTQDQKYTYVHKHMLTAPLTSD